MSEAVEHLDMENVCFVCTNNSFDEISLSHISNVIEYTADNKNSYELSSRDFGFESISLEDIKGSSAKENAEIIHNIFSGAEKEAPYKVVVANAALALKIAGLSDNLAECTEMAKDSIDSGKALEKLNLLKSLGE